jgi:hypothetical protein
VSPPAAGPAAGKGALVDYSNAKAGVGFKYSAAWRPRPNPDYELFLVPADTPKATAATGPAGAAPRSISLDVPDLPAHIPGLIPMGPTEKGYLDDLRKKVGQVKVDELPRPALGAGQVKLVRCTSQGASKPFEETAMIVIHNDHVYILRGTTNRPGDEELRAAFDGIVKSWRWAKK